MKSSPHLLFEFSDANGSIKSKKFSDPVKVLQTTNLEDVKRIIQESELWLDRGYFVAGYVSYEAAPAFDAAFQVNEHPSWPLVWFGIFEAPVMASEKEVTDEFFQTSEWRMQGDFSEYVGGIDKIKQAIERGDTYQVNYTTRLETDFYGDDYAFYKKLVKNQQSAYSAYLNIGEFRILSASPELFFRIDNRRITTKPMKGTAKRGRTTEEDEALKKRLFISEKEQAENLMIVDLLRNDLGRISLPGSVTVPQLFEVETYPTVHQMTSTVRGELSMNTSMYEVFQALFPCGSITGAPKVRTMEYIKKLETASRDVYCGAIGYMTPEREAVFNVPIRTVMVDKTNNKAVYGTGGGVTWDSTSEGEYEELQTKARLLTEARPDFQLLETMRLEDGRIPLLDHHLKRVQSSADYFGFHFDDSRVKEAVDLITLQYQHGSHKIRMLVSADGVPSIEVIPIETTMNKAVCRIATSPVNEEDPFLFHKTTHRAVYEKFNTEDAFSVLLWNTKKELTEFTIANVVVKKDGRYLTPPISSGLLGGTFRKYLIDEGLVSEEVLYKRDLYQFEEVWMVNGVRGWIKVDFLEDDPV